MEVTINYNGQAVAVEVTLEVYEFLDRADHKTENLFHEQRRHSAGFQPFRRRGQSIFDCPVPSSGGCGIDCKPAKIRGHAISPLFTRAHLYTVAGAVRPAGGVAYFVRNGKLRSPNPLCALRSQTPALRLSGSTEPVIPLLKGGVPHRFLSYPRQYHQAQRGPFRCCRSCLPQRNQADK